MTSVSKESINRVVVTYPAPEALLEPLAAHCQVVQLPVGDSLQNSPLLDATVVGLLCLLTDTIDSALLSRLPNLRFVSSVSVGVDHIDVAALSAHRVAVGHTPGVLVDATADTALALMLAAARRVAEADRFIRAGQWRPDNRWAPDFFLGKQVSGAVLGIVGLGAIGQAVAARSQAFGMRVIGWTPSGRVVAGVENTSLDDLLSRSDFVSVHVALADKTRNLIDAGKIALMKHGAVLVNTARGGIVDELALFDALKSGDLFAAGIDVFAIEPVAPDNPLLTLENVVLTPHVGSATAATRGDMVRLAIENARAAVQGKPMPHCVNPQVYR